MSEIKDGGSAFPYCVWVGDHHNGHNTGMSLRNWFAGMALNQVDMGFDSDYKAKMAYSIADAMLRAGEGEK